MLYYSEPCVCHYTSQAHVPVASIPSIVLYYSEPLACVTIHHGDVSDIAEGTDEYDSTVSAADEKILEVRTVGSSSLADTADWPSRWS